jgi:UMF1 family MFS transporter
MIQFMAMPGALFFAKLAEKIGAVRAILFSLITFLSVCIFAYRMTTAYEFWILGGVIAIILGGSQALSRSLFASMVPQQKSAEFFGFFSISSRFASIFGPLLFALVADFSGSSRNSILAIGLFFVVGGILLLQVNVKRGISLVAEQ